MKRPSKARRASRVLAVAVAAWVSEGASASLARAASDFAFLRGDSNLDRELDISDAVHTLSALFGGSAEISCGDAADTNDSGSVDISDPIYSLGFLFQGGPAPPLPFPIAGVDPTADDLVCGDVLDRFELWSGEAMLRGASIYQRRVYPELDGPSFIGPGPVGPPFAASDFDELAALGANLVDISHPGLYGEDAPYRLDARIERNLDRLLDLAEAADLFAVISFRTGPGRSELPLCCPDGAGVWYPRELAKNHVWTDVAAQDAWVAMWRYTAERYRDRAHVAAYDLMVEPNANAMAVGEPIWDPKEFYARYAGSLLDWNELFPRIVAAIREVDPDTPIIVGGMGYSGIGWLGDIRPIDDPRIVYAFHHYEPYRYVYQSPDERISYPGRVDIDWDGLPDTFDRAALGALLAPLDAFLAARKAPVVVNELGVSRWAPGGGAFLGDQLELLESRGVGHAVWLWNPPSHRDPCFLSIDDFDLRHGADPTNCRGEGGDVCAGAPATCENADSPILDALVEHWSRNTIRPSSVR